MSYLHLCNLPIEFHRCSTWDPEFVGAIRRHYTGSAGAPPGKKQGWFVVVDGARVGVIGLGEPAYKLAARRRIGLADARPLPSTVCNFIYRLEIPVDVTSSEILRAWHPVAAADWESRYGWAPIHWETLVDPDEVRGSNPGACFRRAGYRSLGMTTGRGARRPSGHTSGPRVWAPTSKKLVLYRGPLHRQDLESREPEHLQMHADHTADSLGEAARRRSLSASASPRTSRPPTREDIEKALSFGERGEVDE